MVEEPLRGRPVAARGKNPVAPGTPDRHVVARLGATPPAAGAVAPEQFAGLPAAQVRVRAGVGAAAPVQEPARPVPWSGVRLFRVVVAALPSARAQERLPAARERSSVPAGPPPAPAERAERASASAERRPPARAGRSSVREAGPSAAMAPPRAARSAAAVVRPVAGEAASAAAPAALASAVVVPTFGGLVRPGGSAKPALDWRRMAGHCRHPQTPWPQAQAGPLPADCAYGVPPRLPEPARPGAAGQRRRRTTRRAGGLGHWAGERWMTRPRAPGCAPCCASGWSSWGSGGVAATAHAATVCRLGVAKKGRNISEG